MRSHEIWVLGRILFYFYLQKNTISEYFINKTHIVKNEAVPSETRQERQPQRPIVDYQKLMAVTSKHTDITRVAVAAFEEFWKAEIDSGVFEYGEFNMYGVAPKGSNTKKFCLDPQRVLMLQSFVTDKMPSGVDKGKSASRQFTRGFKN